MTGKYGGFFCIFSPGNGLFRGDVSGVCLFSGSGSGSLSGVLRQLTGYWVWCGDGTGCCCGGCHGGVF